MAVEDPAKDPTTAPPAEGAAATDAPSNLNSAYAADVAIREDDDAGDEDMDDDDDEGSEGPIEAGAPFDAVRAQKKRKERLEQNRISARESRKRKKTMIEELQRTVITLSKENKDLNDRNEQLRSQLMDIGRKYPNVVPIQAIMNGAPPPAPQPPPGTSTAAIAQQAGVTAAPMAVFAASLTDAQHSVGTADASAPAPAP